MRSIDPKVRRQILDDLEAAGSIEIRKEKTSLTKPTQSYAWVW
jgi:ribosomal protein S19E (S16A)